MRTGAALRPGAAREFTLRHLVLIGGAGFAVVLAVNVAFIVLALRTFPGEEVRNPYIQGLKFNQAIAARDAALALGWKAHAGLEPDATGGAAVVLRLADREARPVIAAAVSGVLRRPTNARMDHDLVFTQIAPGVFRADVGALAAGQWELRATVQEGVHTAGMTARLTWSTRQP